jgi:hypothetical protein
MSKLQGARLTLVLFLCGLHCALVHVAMRFGHREGWFARWRLTAIINTIAVRSTVAISIVGLLATILVLELLLALRRGRHNPVVVLGVLEVILRGYPISRRVRISRELQILLVNMRGRAADFHLWPTRIERAVATATAATTPIAAAVAMTTLRPAAALT